MVRLTEAETRYLEDSRRILLEVEEADESAAGISATPRGGVILFTDKKAYNYVTNNKRGDRWQDWRRGMSI